MNHPDAYKKHGFFCLGSCPRLDDIPTLVGEAQNVGLRLVKITSFLAYNQQHFGLTFIHPASDWLFVRGWAYWEARREEGKPLPLVVARRLWATHGGEVRENGASGSPYPTCDTSFYHIDTPEGLAALVKALDEVYDGFCNDAS